MADRDEATQDPTAARLRRAEHAGQFARSRDLAVALVWMGSVALLATFGTMLWQLMDQFSQNNWSNFEVSDSAHETLQGNLAAARSVFWSGLFPIIGGVAAITVLVWTAQSGFRLFPHLAAPDINRLNPVRNLTRMLSAEHFVSVAFGLLKLLVLLIVAAWVMLGDLETLTRLGMGPLQQQSQSLVDWLMAMVQRLCVAAIAVGIGDYGMRWWLQRRSLRMTDQEQRDEQRSSEPSPEVSARRRMRRTS